MRVRCGTALVLSCAALVVVCAAPGRAKQAKPEPCPGGRYLTANAVITGDAREPFGAVIIGPEISIGTMCDPVRAKLKATAHGTSVRAVWRSCAGLRGKVRLK